MAEEVCMARVEAVIFDLGGTLVDWPEWDEDAPRRWAISHEYLSRELPRNGLPGADEYVRAMLEAEEEHWRVVRERQTSAPPEALMRDGFRRLGIAVGERELLVALDGYAQAVTGWAVAFPDAANTLEMLRSEGFRLGLLSNTWWAADWHNADLAAHGLDRLLDAVVYTSTLPHSKPHPSVFREVTRRLGVAPEACVMIGDRMIDDVGGALGVGMRAVWRRNTMPWPVPPEITPTAIVDSLSELPGLIRKWNEAEG